MSSQALPPAVIRLIVSGAVYVTQVVREHVEHRIKMIVLHSGWSDQRNSMTTLHP